MKPSVRWRQAHLALSMLALGLLALPPARLFLEASMARHMLVQYPLLACIGGVFASALPACWVQRVSRWNDHGITGLFGTALLMAILMIPRVLDLALVDGWIEVAKWLALLACGMALGLSWRPAGLMVQGFFLGNVLPMTAVVGYLLQTSPVRVCNAYLLDDQEKLGQWLVGLALFLGLAWLFNVVRTLMRREAAALLPAPACSTAATTESGSPGNR